MKKGFFSSYFHFSLSTKEPNHSENTLEVNDKVIEITDMQKSLYTKGLLQLCSGSAPTWRYTQKGKTQKT